jgi:hypothetical protein
MESRTGEKREVASGGRRGRGKCGGSSNGPQQQRVANANGDLGLAFVVRRSWCHGRGGRWSGREGVGRADAGRCPKPPLSMSKATIIIYANVRSYCLKYRPVVDSGGFGYLLFPAKFARA